MTIGNIIASIQLIISLTCLSQGKAKQRLVLLLQSMFKIAQKKYSSEGKKVDKTKKIPSPACECNYLNFSIVNLEGTRKMRSGVEHLHGHERQLKQRSFPQWPTDR